MKCNSTYENQLGTGVGEAVNWVATNVADPLLNVGSTAFCTIFPVACDKKTWIIVCIICILIIAGVFVVPMFLK